MNSTPLSAGASASAGRELGVQSGEHIDSGNCIACPGEGERMQVALSMEDKQYIRNLLAEGIAKMLVEKVSKSTVSAVDKSEPERYTPPTK